MVEVGVCILMIRGLLFTVAIVTIAATHIVTSIANQIINLKILLWQLIGLLNLLFVEAQF